MERVYISLKEHKLFGPAAVIFGHLIILTLQRLANCIQELDGQFLSHAVVGAFLTGAYIYSWTMGNPHAGVPYKNQPVYEVPLTLASGYYASGIFSSRTCTDTIHNLISIMAVSGIFTDGSGANVFATYSFLAEIAPLVDSMRDCAVKRRHPCKSVLDTVYPLVLVGTRTFALWHLTYMILVNEISLIHKIETVILTICSFYNFKKTFNKSMCRPITPPRRGRSTTGGRVRGRSRTSVRSRSRSNLRTRSRSRLR